MGFDTILDVGLTNQIEQ